MPKYVIEREHPGCRQAVRRRAARHLRPSPTQVLAEMEGRAKWQQSYVTDDKIYCVYVAENEDAVLEHAQRGGFPADAVSQVGTVIDPATGE